MYGHDEDSAIEYATQDYWAGKGGEHLDKMREVASEAGATAFVLGQAYDDVTVAMRNVARQMDALKAVESKLREIVAEAEAGLEAAQADALRRARNGGE